MKLPFLIKILYLDLRRNINGQDELSSFPFSNHFPLISNIKSKFRTIYGQDVERLIKMIDSIPMPIKYSNRKSFLISLLYFVCIRNLKTNATADYIS
jgi:hypothetical protein